MRLNKHIAESGHCSRREADRLIAEKRVTVNGIPAGIGTQVEEGDEVLVDAAKKLESMLRAEDAVGRMGGDEFMLCLKNIPKRETVAKRCKQICEVLCADIGEDVKISASLGIAIYPSDGTTFQELYQNSDTAVYIAKKNGKKRCQFYRNL